MTEHLAARSGARAIAFTDKSFPARAHGLTAAEFLTGRGNIAEFSTPLLALDAAAVEHNLGTMAQWVAERGFELMPHGKTTMAPALWERQLDAGATGITLATAWQAQLGLEAGVPVVQLANELGDARGIARLGALIAQRPEQRLLCWVDSTEGVTLLEEVLGADLARPFEVLVDLGATGGRSGARGVEAAAVVAERVAASSSLRLAGVAGYEGALAHDREGASLVRVRGYLEDLVALFERVRPLAGEGAIVSAGGSAYFDLVAEVLGPLAQDGTVRAVLRSGAYLTHDSGFYRGISPLDQAATDAESERFRSALLAYATVVSTPEAGLALLDAGKRDFPFDEGLPTVLARTDRMGGAETPLPGEITALNDQHAFLRTSPADRPRIGEVIRLGLSHPCTAFDKWRLIPVVDTTTGTVVDIVETWF